MIRAFAVPVGAVGLGLFAAMAALFTFTEMLAARGYAPPGVWPWQGALRGVTLACQSAPLCAGLAAAWAAGASLRGGQRVLLAQGGMGANALAGLAALAAVPVSVAALVTAGVIIPRVWESTPAGVLAHMAPLAAVPAFTGGGPHWRRAGANLLYEGSRVGPTAHDVTRVGWDAAGGGIVHDRAGQAVGGGLAHAVSRFRPGEDAPMSALAAEPWPWFPAGPPGDLRALAWDPAAVVGHGRAVAALGSWARWEPWGLAAAALVLAWTAACARFAVPWPPRLAVDVCCGVVPGLVFAITSFAAKGGVFAGTLTAAGAAAALTGVLAAFAGGGYVALKCHNPKNAAGAAGPLPKNPRPPGDGRSAKRAG